MRTRMKDADADQCKRTLTRGVFIGQTRDPLCFNLLQWRHMRVIWGFSYDRQRYCLSNGLFSLRQMEASKIHITSYF